jgi:hypothetical protein
MDLNEFLSGDSGWMVSDPETIHFDGLSANR